MRNPKRIKRITKSLEKTWSKFPDMRLGQFLETFVFGHHISNKCIFYTEDDEVEKKLKVVENYKKNH